ncbi:MAG: Rieske 2Fe-2S domain-containing protein [Microthrixaceae bacterium]
MPQVFTDRTHQKQVTDGPLAASAEQPRPFKYSLPDRPEPPPIPNGWYAIVGSHELVAGQIHSVIAVGKELVVYRGESGNAVVMDAHCPHLGAHLGGGWISEDSIHCPYHGWEYDSGGACVNIPYSEGRIPAKACVPTYPVCEQDGFVFFWYHSSQLPPSYKIPRVSEVEDPEWSDALVWQFELVAALQEMAENNVDYAHLKFVHRREGIPTNTSRFMMDGPFSTVVEQLPDGSEFDRHTWGPGIALLRLPDLMTVFTTTTPIDRQHCRLHWHFFFKGSVAEMADELVAGVTGEFGLEADVPIWRDKVFLTQPLLIKADGHIAEFRRWYSQFYEDS